MEGLGYKRDEFDDVALLPASRAYRKWLDRVSSNQNWLIGAAALTIFVEGSVNDRRELLHPSEPKTRAAIEKYVHRHPLVRYHGLSPAHLDLVRAHQMVEAGHRQDAYRMILTHAVTPPQQQAILACLNRARTLWLRYRDNVARACGLRPS
jgi:hypothetical protein